MNQLHTYKEKDKVLFDAVRAFKAGDDSKANLIYELSEKYIYSCIHQIEKNEANIEDMMQETYLQVFNKMDTLEDAEKFLVWAGRIATNCTLRFLQKYKKECLVMADEEGETDFIFDSAAEDKEAFIPETVLDNRETQRLIADIVDGLSPAQKLCVQYFYYDEMSVNDIAKAMNCSAGTVKSRLNYARKSIKEAVIDLDVKQGTRLYSLASMPLFLLVFRAGVEDMAAGLVAGALGAGTAAEAIGGGSSAAGVLGGTSVEAVSTAGAVGGTAAEGAGIIGGVSAAGSAGGGVAAGGLASGGGAAVTGGTVVTGSTATGGAAAGLGAKIFGTAAGKAVVGVLAATLVGGGAYVATQKPAEPVPQESVAETVVEEVVEEAEEEEEGLEVRGYATGSAYLNFVETRPESYSWSRTLDWDDGTYKGDDRAYYVYLTMEDIQGENEIYELSLDSTILNLYEENAHSSEASDASGYDIDESSISDGYYYTKMVTGYSIFNQDTLLFKVLYPYFEQGANQISVDGSWTEADADFIGFPEQGIEFTAGGDTYRIYDLERVALTRWDTNYEYSSEYNYDGEHGKSGTGRMMRFGGKIELVSKGTEASQPFGDPE